MKKDINEAIAKKNKKFPRSSLAKQVAKFYKVTGVRELRIKSLGYDEQLPLFPEFSDGPEYGHIFVCVSGHETKRILVFTFQQLQEELSKYMDSIGVAREDPDRNLRVVLESKRYWVLDNFLEAVSDH